MRFRNDNRIKFDCDFHQCQGLPAGIDFTVEPFKEGVYKLTGPGYGKSKDYGNGALYVWGLTVRQKKRFEKEITGLHKTTA